MSTYTHAVTATVCSIYAALFTKQKINDADVDDLLDYLNNKGGV